MDLETRLIQSQLLGINDSPESRLGFQSAIKWCLRKRDEGWTIEQFIENKRHIVNQYEQFKGSDYYESYIAVLNLNIRELIKGDE